MADTKSGPPVLKVVGGLFGLLSWLFFLGLQRVWHFTFGWLFKTLADLLDRVGIPTGFFGTKHLFGSVSAWLRSLDRNVANQLAHLADQSERLAVWLFSRLRLTFGWIGREIEGLAGDVLGFAARLVRVTIPRLVGRLLRFVWKELRKLGRFARGLAKTVYALRHKFGKFLLWTTRKFFKLQLWAVKRLGHLFTFFWGHVFHLIGRVLALEHKLIPKGFRKPLLAALGPLGLIWLISDSAITFGKSIVRWSYKEATALARYFGKLDDPIDLHEFVAVEKELTKLILHELAFIVSEFKPEKLAPPGPPFGPEV